MAQINKPNQYFNTIIYTGNNNQSQTISGVGFQPDWIWIKNSDNTEWHHLMDVVRGDNKFLHTNNTDAESTGNRGNGHNALAFTSDGFSITNATQEDGDLNFGSRPYPTWCWKANGSPSSNTDGSITSNVSANQTAGFSIVTYTGTGSNATIGHGLNKKPDAVFFKRLDTTGGWASYHSVLGATKYMRLDSNSGEQTASDEFQNTEPTSSVISIGTDGAVNGTSMVAYCFANKAGFSRMGSYVGNGSNDGTFIYTGFKPAFLIYKQSSASGESWIMHDNARNLFNVTNKRLLANASNAEADEPIDFLSNGFKCRTSGAFQNASGSTYIYMAFAENPLVGTNGVPATAR